MADLNVTDRFVYALAGCKTRDDAARLYCIALGGEAEWPIINRLIIDRWSTAGLIWIKERAWKYREGNIARAAAALPAGTTDGEAQS